MKKSPEDWVFTDGDKSKLLMRPDDSVNFRNSTYTSARNFPLWPQYKTFIEKISTDGDEWFQELMQFRFDVKIIGEAPGQSWWYGSRATWVAQLDSDEPNINLWLPWHLDSNKILLILHDLVHYFPRGEEKRFRSLDADWVKL